MNKEKQIGDCKNCNNQIEEMAKVIANKTTLSIIEATGVAEILTIEGCHKQSEGEWIPIIDEPTPLRECAILSGYECSECGRYEKEKQPYCNCGAKMFVRMTHTCPHNIPNLIPTIEELLKGGAE